MGTAKDCTPDIVEELDTGVRKVHNGGKNQGWKNDFSL